MNNCNIGLITSGYNNRAVVLCCRFFKENNDSFCITNFLDDIALIYKWITKVDAANEFKGDYFDCLKEIKIK